MFLIAPLVLKKIIINMLEANRDKVSTPRVTQQLDSELVEAAESICTVRLIERRDGKEPLFLFL